MKQQLSLRTLLNGLLVDVPDITLSGLTLDNRRVQPGMAFIALQGTRQHGLAYAQAAVDAGAVAVLYEPTAEVTVPVLNVPTLAVPHLRSLLGKLGALFYQQPSADLFMVGVTGTDGKTSVTHFIAEALQAAGQAAAVIGTLGIGTPGALQAATHTTPDALTVQRLLAELHRDQFHAVAMEVSSHALDQGRVNEVAFEVAVLTNLTRDHLDYHGTVEAYAQAKRQLFHWPTLKTAVLNLDDAFGRSLVDELKSTSVTVLGYGVGQIDTYPPATLVATKAVFDHSGINATVTYGQEQGQLQAPVLGHFNLHNLLAALGVLIAKGMSLAQGLACLKHVWVVPGRMERVSAEQDQGKLVVVDYAHTPAALTQVLTAIRVHTRGRLFCVFGCGGDRDRGKRPLMAQAAESMADVVIITDDNPRTENPQHIFEDIMQGLKHSENVLFEHDRAKAIRLAISQAQTGDTVLIAGKGHETVQILADRTIPFDDRQQAAHILRELSA